MAKQRTKGYMTNEISLRLAKTSLGAAQYFKSLLAKAGPFAEDIRAQTVRLAEKLAVRMTFGASSSIRAEVAQALIESAMYCIGYRLKGTEEGNAINMLCSVPVQHIWKEGRDNIRAQSEQLRRTHTLLQGMFKTENRAYNDTLRDGFSEFFAQYDADFAANETPGLLDYPLNAEIRNLTGIEYISEYMRRLAIETALCAKFPVHTEALLMCLGRDYREIYVNIYEMVLTNAVGRVLCGEDLSSLDINEEVRERLKASLGSMKKGRLCAVLRAAAERVCSLIGVADEQARGYARYAMKGISVRVQNALDTGSLDAVFMGYRAEKPLVRFEDGSNMDDEIFREVLEELRECRIISDKLAIIKRHAASIGDLEDILGASYLFDNEFEAVFRTLDDDALALLWLRLPEDDALHVSRAEEEWHGALLDYLEAEGKTDRVREKAESLDM